MSAVGAVGRAVEDYLVERQRLGYRMHDSELRRFARYADPGGHLKLLHPWPGQTPPPEEQDGRTLGGL